jgi:hypothetical protein
MIPSRVWNHPVQVDLKWMRPILDGILDRETGVTIVEFLGDARREYAMAKFLREARDINSLIPLRWISYYGLRQNEHTGAYPLKKTRGFMCVSVVTPPEDDSLLDLVTSHTGVVVVGSVQHIPFLVADHSISLAKKL